MGSRKRPQKRRKGNKRSTHGRKARQCEAYRRQGRRERNKARRLRQHLAANPNDSQARECLDGL